MRFSSYWNISAKTPVGLKGNAVGVYKEVGVVIGEGVGVNEGKGLVKVGVAVTLDGLGLVFGAEVDEGEIMGEDAGDAGDACIEFGGVPVELGPPCAT